MSGLFLLMGLLGIVAATSLAVMEYHEHVGRLRSWQTVRLRFGRETSADGVVQVLSRIAGLRAGTVVKVDVVGDHDEVTHYLGADQASMETLRGVFRAIMPGLRMEPVAAKDLPRDFRFGRTIRLGGRLNILSGDDLEAASAGLLASLQPLAENERVLLRWTLRPSTAIRVPVQTRDGSSVPGDDRTMLRAKNAGGVIQARGVIGTSAGHPKRSAHLVGRVTAVLRSRATSAGTLRTFVRSRIGVRRELERMPIAGIGFDRYGVRELAGLIGWPVDEPALPGVSVGTSPMRMPDRRLPSSGRVMGEATWPGEKRVVAQPVTGALSHSLVAGPTGYGKSTLLVNLAVQDMEAGRGLVVIDGKGDTVSALLARVPEARRGDVVVLDCASDDALPGISLFGIGSPELAADVVLGVFAEIWRDSWGPLSERYLRAGLVAVGHDEHGTLADVPYVFTSAAYRRRLMGRMRDPLSRGVLQAYEAMSAGERAQQLAAPLGKLGSLLGRPVVRTVLGQSDATLDFGNIIRDRKIVLVSLNPRRVGSGASQLLGAVIVHALFQAVLGRASVAERQRTPFMVAIDEVKALGHLPMPLDGLLEQARGLGVGVTLAPQSLAQLPKAVTQAILTNAATRLAFAQNADDARLLARDLPGVTPDDLQDLGRFEVMARIGLGPGELAGPVTIRTRRLGPVVSDEIEIRRTAAGHYGKTSTEVDAALDAKHQVTPGGGTDAGSSVGRTRRQS